MGNSPEARGHSTGRSKSNANTYTNPVLFFYFIYYRKKIITKDFIFSLSLIIFCFCVYPASQLLKK